MSVVQSVVLIKTSFFQSSITYFPVPIWSLLLCITKLIWCYCRACRLKKKAQYEANKVKLWGLSTEYGTLLMTPHTLQFLHQVHQPLYNYDDYYCI